MQNFRDLYYLLALQRAKGVGDLTARKLIAACGSAEAVFSEKLSLLSRIEGVGVMAVRAVRNRRNLIDAEKEMTWLQKHKIRVMPYSDPEYPFRLKHCPDGPLVLFTKGNIRLDVPRFLSVVGTRRLTTRGMEFTQKLIEDLAPLQPTIVSGYAYGADICAHRAAIDNGLQTIACMAHGLDITYPSAHKVFNESVMENGGFVTDFWHGEMPDRDHFLRRNRIIAGLSQAVVVIESAEKGGSLVTADIANSYNREVFAIPGRPEDPFSKGCNLLIKKHQAHLMESAADLIYMLGWDPDENKHKVPVQKKLFVELDATEELVLSRLQDSEKMLLDDLAYTCDIPVHKLSATLLNMEMKGVVRPLPGKYFERV